MHVKYYNFSIGLYRLHPDGSLMLNSQDQPIPTYDQEEIIGFAHAFTGTTIRCRRFQTSELVTK